MKDDIFKFVKILDHSACSLFHYKSEKYIYIYMAILRKYAAFRKY